MDKKISISLCMIVRDEEETLERCLNSVRDIADEIIIVDTGSIDKTKEIAKKFNSKIYNFKWIDDFAVARNHAFSKATKEYIIWLDADDYISDTDREKLIKLKGTLDRSVDSVTMNYSLCRDEKGNTTFSLRRNRLVKRKKNFKWIGKIHEYLEVYGNIINEDISVNHDKLKPHGDRNLKIFQSMVKNNEEFSARDTYYYANELYYNAKYEDAIVQYEKFIDSKLGWIEDVKTATSNLFECYSRVGKEEKRASAILKTFELDIPKSDLCCKLGQCFLEKNLYKQAIFWYKVALGCVHEEDNLGMDHKEYYTWIPAIQLCVAYSAIGDYEAAYYYNELTALYIPSSPKVEHNRNFLYFKFKELNMKIPKLKFDLADNRYFHM